MPLVAPLATALGAGAVSVVPHGLVDPKDGTPLTPAMVLADRATPITVTAITSTTVTFTNPSALPQTATFVAIYLHSIQAAAGVVSGVGWAGVSTSGGGPAGVITVATSGGDFTTIAAGLAAAGPGSVVVVYPGDYAESSLVIPATVRLVGYPVAQNVRIIGANANDTRVFMNDSSTLREITVVAPSGSANPGIDASGLGVGEIGVLLNVVVVGAGGTGPLIRGAGLGQLAIFDVAHNGGNASHFIQLTGGGCAIKGLIATGGTVTTLLEVGAARLNGQILITTVTYVCTNAIYVTNAAAEIQFDGITLTEFPAPIAVNALRIGADGVDISLSGAHLHGSAFDILVDGGLVGTGTILDITGEVRLERTSFPAGWSSTAMFNASVIDGGIENDPAVRVFGELSVGTPENPSETAMGEGDSSVNNMLVFSFDGAATYVDNTAAAQSRAGSTFALLQAVAAGNIAYIGNTTRTFNGIKVDVTAAQVTGAGTAVWEYWNGAAWTAFLVMASGANASYAQYAQNVFTRIQSDQIRFGTMAGWATTAVDGSTAYWVRYRLTVGITTVPTLERIKIGTNRTEVNSDGFLEYFGAAESTHTLWLGTGGVLSAPSGGANSPNTQNVTVSANISYQQLFTRYNNGLAERAGTMIEIPDGLDTSKPLTMTIAWVTSGASAVAVRWDLYTAAVVTGNVVGALAETLTTQSIAPTGVANTVIVTTFTFTAPTLLVGNFLAFMLWRQGTIDINPDDADVLTLALSGSFWH